MDRNLLKRTHEKWVADELLKDLKLHATFLRHGDDITELDTIYNLENGEKLGIEVSTVYYENSDAKQLWSIARGERQLPSEGFELRPGGTLFNPDDLICQRTQTILDKKTKKLYAHVNKTWLVIYQDAPLNDKQAVLGCVERLVVPASHPFNSIYLLYRSPVHEGSMLHSLEIANLSFNK